MSRPLALVVLASTVACAAGERPAAPGDFRGQLLEEPVVMPPAVIDDATGAPFDLRARTAGRVALLFFGYTHCPDVCPVHMANLAAVMRHLPLEVTREIDVLFVTTDPVRDTPERLRDWLGALHPRFVGLRGTRAQIEALERAVGVPVSVVEGDFVGHAAQVLAFGKDGVARLAYPFGTRQQDWIADLPRLVRGEAPAPAGGS